MSGVDDGVDDNVDAVVLVMVVLVISDLRVVVVSTSIIRLQ